MCAPRNSALQVATKQPHSPPRPTFARVQMSFLTSPARRILHEVFSLLAWVKFFHCCKLRAQFWCVCRAADNEWGYSQRVVDLAELAASKGKF